MKWILILLLLWCPTAWAANVAICQPDGTFVNYLPSVNTPVYVNGVNIISPDMSAVQGVPLRYWKCGVGRVIRMNAIERAQVDNAIAVRHAQIEAKHLDLRQALGLTEEQYRFLQGEGAP